MDYTKKKTKTQTSKQGLEDTTRPQRADLQIV